MKMAKHILLVGGAITILKNMTSSMGRIIYPIHCGKIWKIKAMFETTNQIYDDMSG